MKSRLLLFVGLVGLSGCATTYKDFKVADVKPNEGIVIGKVNVKYNGKDFNKECGICLNSTNGPCQALTESGFVFENVPKGEASLKRVACKDVSLQHFNLNGANFSVVDGVTYFGQVDIGWANKGGFKATDMFGLVGAMAAESNNDGVIKMTIKDGNMNELLKAYEQQTQQKIKPVKSLVKDVY